MRDLRAELKDWNNDAPIEWQPAEGDILVGFIREARAIDGRSEQSVVVDEERTGIPVLVSLDSPVLSGLFELHNPRCRDRVGIKCTGLDTDGVRRFVMVVDRDIACEREECEDDLSGASSEERDYIEGMLSESLESEADPAPVNEFGRALTDKAGAAFRSVGVLPILMFMLFLGALLAACPGWLLALLH